MAFVKSDSGYSRSGDCPTGCAQHERMKIIDPCVGTDDYGRSVYRIGGEKLVTVDECSIWPCYMPGVKGFFLREKGYTKQDYRDEVRDLNALDANCNTCEHLIRVPFSRDSKAQLMVGKCGHHPYKPEFTFHPDDFMGMKCWEPRR